MRYFLLRVLSHGILERKEDIVVYNRDFVEKNFLTDTKLKGIFSLGEESIEIQKEIEEKRKKIDEIEAEKIKAQNSIDRIDIEQADLRNAIEQQNGYSFKSVYSFTLFLYDLSFSQ